MNRRKKLISEFENVDGVQLESIPSQGSLAVAQNETQSTSGFSDNTLSATFPVDDYSSTGSSKRAEDGTLASDESLVRDYLANGCAETFETLIRRYEREIYTFLRRFLGDVQAAEDVFQATFLNVHLRLNQFEEGRKFRPWLYAIANNKAIDHMRRNRRHKIGSLNITTMNSDKEESLAQHIAGDETRPDELASRLETSERVRQALLQLNEPTQELLNLAFYQGLKYADIAEILQIPLGTVKSRVFTAIRKLNAIWVRMEESDAKKGRPAS